MEIKGDTPTGTKSAVAVLSAIAHEGRLMLLRQLIQAGSHGMAAGELAKFASVAAPTASAQLLILSNAELVFSERQGRNIIYFANYATMSELLTFLVKDCCCADQNIYSPLLASLS